MKPELQELAASNTWSTTVGTVNIDTEDKLAARYNVSVIPTLLIFRDGKLVSEEIGYKPRADIERLLFD